MLPPATTEDGIVTRGVRRRPGLGPDVGAPLRMLAPYFAVLVFWCGFDNAWLAILAYHAQILFWIGRSPGGPGSLRLSRPAWLALPSALAGPALFFVLPLVARTDLSSWLGGHRLGGASLLLMAIYYGLVHPVLEQLHWAPLRARTPLAHFLFAGYHMIVLRSLLPVAWLLVSFAVLTGASFMWQEMERRTGGLVVPIASHVLADLGIVGVALLLT